VSMYSDNSRKTPRTAGGFSQESAGEMMTGPSPRDMGQQLALQLLTAFGNSPHPDADAAEALAHAQLWLCNMRKAGLLTPANSDGGFNLGMAGPSMQGFQMSAAQNMMAQQLQTPMGNMQAMPLMPSSQGHGFRPPARQHHEQSGEPKGGRIRTAVGVKFDDWKDRPSEFLREYGDPAAVKGSGARPGAGVNGNWECEGCGNINFPRRSNCLRCHVTRSENGEHIVREYVRGLIEKYNNGNN